jgi:hypothetical protein
MRIFIFSLILFSLGLSNAYGNGNIRLGGYVFNDLNENCLFDSNETPYKNIEVTIQGCGFGPITVLTDVIGWWEIDNVPDCNCIEVFVPQNMFDVTIGPFGSHEICGTAAIWNENNVSGITNNSDFDSQGNATTGCMPLFCGSLPDMDGNGLLSIDFGFYFECNNSTPNTFPTCEVAGAEENCDPGGFYYLCNITHLDNFCGTLPIDNPSGPSPLCDDGGVADNMWWISFIAGENIDSFEMIVVAPDCSPLGGLQWGIVSDCNFTQVDCNATCTGQDSTFISTDLMNPGQKYWLWLDGCNGFSCDFKIDLLSGEGTFNFPSIEVSNCSDCLESSTPQSHDYNLCIGASGVSFCIDSDSGDYENINSDYYWNIDSDLDGIPSNFEKDGNLGFTEENCISLDLDPDDYPIGDYELCMTWVGSCCDSEGPFCMTIHVVNHPSCDSNINNVAQNLYVGPTCEMTTENPICNLSQVENVTFSMISDENQTGPFPSCSNGDTSENASWISFIAGADAADFELELFLSNCQADIGETPGVKWGIVSDCNFTEVICDGICSTGNEISIQTSDLIPGEQYWLWLDGCNNTSCNFQLVFNAGLNEAVAGDNCIDCPYVIQPETDLSGQLNFTCLTSNMSEATPETDIFSCGFNNMPTLWFQVTPDSDASQLFVNVDVLEGSWTPVFAIFEGTCEDLSVVSTAESPSCNINWSDISQINQPVQNNNTYWIAVGASGDIDDINEFPDFELCVSTTIVLISCLGNSGGQCDDLTNWQLFDSSNPNRELGELENQNQSEMPFLCPGETIELCGLFVYDASATNEDWLSGIVPILGEGWDLETFDPSMADLTANGQDAVWFDDMDTLAPIIQENVGTLCTYTDSFGNLQICNALCNSCPCTPGLSSGSPLPGGWFWVTPGGNAGCENDGSPGEGWGIGTVVAEVFFCFELTVRDDFLTDNECSQADLKVGFQTFSDGVAGCWEDPSGECLLDEAQIINFNIQCDETIFYADNDGDSYGDPLVSVSNCYQPIGYVTNSDDCDDNDPAINPSAPELCDGIDNNCDGLIDNDINFMTFYIDADNDGFGSSDMSITDCQVPTGYVTNDLDCDDTQASINPDAIEICDEIDNNCDGDIDEGLTTVYYFDNDNDSFGDPNNSIESCTQPTGAVLDNTDCDDADANVNPSATELCDGIDNNCDGEIDEGFTFLDYYADADMDGFGNPDDIISACEQAIGYVLDNTDCDDTDANVNPGATELCDGIDNNCDDEIDEGFTFLDYYADNDMDGFGNPDGLINACEQPAGYVLDNTDCNDTNPEINPSAEEIDGNGIDEDCDGTDGISATHDLAGREINIYPNPTTGKVFITVKGSLDASIELFDITGKRIFRQRDLEVDLSDFNNGLYLLRVIENSSKAQVVERILLSK